MVINQIKSDGLVFHFGLRSTKSAKNTAVKDHNLHATIWFPLRTLRFSNQYSGFHLELKESVVIPSDKSNFHRNETSLLLHIFN